LTALLSLAGCRCGADDEQAQLAATEPSTTPTIDTRARTQPLRTLVIGDASQLDEVDLSTVESLDLALSERDGQERPLPETGPVAEPAPAITEDEGGETGERIEGPARANPRCASVAVRGPCTRVSRRSGSACASSSSSISSSMP
jgi:hypothetical protein